MTTGVLLVDDHPIYLQGLRDLVDSQPELSVVDAVSSGEQAVESAQRYRPGIVVTDISMVGIGGIEAARQIKATLPNVEILFLSMHAEQKYVLSALRAGGSGYLLKDAVQSELIHALSALRKHQFYLSPGISKYVVNAYLSDNPDDDEVTVASLSNREREVLCMIASGDTTKSIGQKLAISPKTVATHREHLLKKIGAHNVAGLVRFALREGLVTED